MIAAEIARDSQTYRLRVLREIRLGCTRIGAHWTGEEKKNVDPVTSFTFSTDVAPFIEERTNPKSSYTTTADRIRNRADTLLDSR